MNPSLKPIFSYGMLPVRAKRCVTSTEQERLLFLRRIHFTSTFILIVTASGFFLSTAKQEGKEPTSALGSPVKHRNNMNI